MELSAWNGAIETIYAAAAEPGRWPETIQVIADLLDARGGTLLFRRDNGQIGVIVSPTLVDMVAEYQARWHHLDVRAEHVFRVIASGQRDVEADHNLFTEAEAANLPIYRDFLWPHGLGWGMGVSVSPISNVAVALNILRARDKPGYDEKAQEQLLALSRHVERALSLSIRLMDAEAERVGLAEALDSIACGAFVLDHNRRVLLANQTAKRLLGTGLVVSAGRLSATDRDADKALLARLNAIDADGALSADARSVLVVPNDERGLIVRVLPLSPPQGTPALQTASAIVLVEDPASKNPFDPAVVRDAFKLTLGEARLASLIGTGAGPAEAAISLGIAEATARTVLKRLFDKMGVSRQSELAALMGELFMLRQR